MSAKKFNTPQNAYNSVIQSAAEPEKAIAPAKPELYRMSLALPIECKDYLKEIAWQNKTSVNAYITNIILKDKEAHPEWLETFDPTLK